MNQRVDELAKQCWSHYIDGTLIDGHLHFDHRKFAELIVKECAGVAEVSMPINSYPDDRLTVKNNVLKHFGVEE